MFPLPFDFRYWGSPFPHWFDPLVASKIPCFGTMSQRPFLISIFHKVTWKVTFSLFSGNFHEQRRNVWWNEAFIVFLGGNFWNFFLHNAPIPFKKILDPLLVSTRNYGSPKYLSAIIGPWSKSSFQGYKILDYWNPLSVLSVCLWHLRHKLPLISQLLFPFSDNTDEAAILWTC